MNCIGVFGFLGAPRVNSALVIGQNVATYAVAPDSNSVIYRANQDNAGIVELYRAAARPARVRSSTRRWSLGRMWRALRSAKVAVRT